MIPLVAFCTAVAPMQVEIAPFKDIGGAGPSAQSLSKGLARFLSDEGKIEVRNSGRYDYSIRGTVQRGPEGFVITLRLLDTKGALVGLLAGSARTPADLTNNFSGDPTYSPKGLLGEFAHRLAAHWGRGNSSDVNAAILEAVALLPANGLSAKAEVDGTISITSPVSGKVSIIVQRDEQSPTIAVQSSIDAGATHITLGSALTPKDRVTVVLSQRDSAKGDEALADEVVRMPSAVTVIGLETSHQSDLALSSLLWELRHAKRTTWSAATVKSEDLSLRTG